MAQTVRGRPSLNRKALFGGWRWRHALPVEPAERTIAGDRSDGLVERRAVAVQDGQALTLQASGEKAASFAGLEGSAGQTVSLGSDLELSAKLVSRAETAQADAGNRLSGAVGLTDLIQTALTTISSALNGTGGASEAMAIAAEGWLAHAADAPNTDYAGSYVFGGAGAETAPVDLDTTDEWHPRRPAVGRRDAA